MPSFSALDSAGKTTVGVLGDALGQHGGVGDDDARLGQRLFPDAAAGQVAHGVDLEEVERGDVAGDGRGGDLGGAATCLDLGVAGAGVGQRARLADAAGVGAGGYLEQAGAVASGEAELVGDPQQRRQRVGGQRLAPEDDDVLAAVAQQLGQLVDVAGAGSA